MPAKSETETETGVLAPHLPSAEPKTDTSASIPLFFKRLNERLILALSHHLNQRLNHRLILVLSFPHLQSLEPETDTGAPVPSSSIINWAISASQLHGAAVRLQFLCRPH